MYQKRCAFKRGLISLIFTLFSSMAIASSALPEVMIIVDGSGSMWGKVGDTSKIAAAKKVFGEVLPTFSSEAKVGLIAYGHREKGACDDIELLQALQDGSHKALVNQVEALSPKGKTPMADAIIEAARSFSKSDAKKMILLLSDGIETCNDDPCAVVHSLKAKHAELILHVVGFGIGESEKTELTCMAKAGGGHFYLAHDADRLKEVLSGFSNEVTEAVAAAKTVSKKAYTGLGKLHMTLPKEAAISLAEIKLVRTKDAKVVKTIASIKHESTHTLPSARYEVILGFANPNYRAATDISIGTFDIYGKETTELNLGALSYNLAPSLSKIPTEAVVISSNEHNLTLELHNHNNDYYLYKPKPLPEGNYSVGFLYAQSPEPIYYENNVEIKKGIQNFVTIDSGLKLQRPAEGGDVKGWELLQNGTKKLIVNRRWDNDYPLWKSFAVPPGTYTLQIIVNGMDEPLIVSEELQIKRGELTEFDTGL